MEKTDDSTIIDVRLTSWHENDDITTYRSVDWAARRLGELEDRRLHKYQNNQMEELMNI